MRRKVSGNKDELQSRLEEVFEENDKGWLGRTSANGQCESICFLSSGSCRNVELTRFTKGPRKGECGVWKVFRDDSKNLEGTYFEKDIQAVQKAGTIIKAFNMHNEEEHPGCRRVYLNKPEVWSDVGTEGKGNCLVEPYIEGKYVKFNSNTGWKADGFELMQALSHFSFHHSDGQYLLCDLQGGMKDTFYILTDPVVLSRAGGEYGVTDTGLEGMETFFAHHRCNRFCSSNWKRIANAKPRMAAVAATSFTGCGSRVVNQPSGHRQPAPVPSAMPLTNPFFDQFFEDFFGTPW
eukprot:CAMPEP_0178424154 /NCGR_PEP_ID=MMETSP0689_2-20121128/28063_1 /TAXON_ID=160604 /ORGANISM="Amphidinium massartii, Strain CS-259" /LENGTH=292 /DNA_ID=CAMNT_0020045781 /DNA_START=55 /DNA_END=933 /DNA_ORIENTATION=+